MSATLKEIPSSTGSVRRKDIDSLNSFPPIKFTAGKEFKRKDTDDRDHNPLFYVFSYILYVFLLSGSYAVLVSGEQLYVERY
jgi:hypothetical protein